MPCNEHRGHYRIATLASRLDTLLSRFVMRKMKQAGIEDIVAAHGDVLAVLFARSECTMSEIARASGRTRATVTVLVDKLEHKGYVVRRSNALDARSSLVSLTDKGESLRQVFEEISRAMDEELLAALGREGADALEAHLARALELLPAS